jgi:hypothetical protein
MSNYLHQNILKAMELFFSPDRPICWFVFKAIHGDASCLLRGIIFAVGKNKEMHLSPT